MTQILVQGLLLSGLYALIATGFTLIFSVGRVLNLAYGAGLMVGAYSYYWLVQVSGQPRWAGIVFALAVGAGLGILKHRLLVKPLKSDPVPVEIATLILAVVLQATIVLLFGDSTRIMHPIAPGVWRTGETVITLNLVLATLASWALLISLVLFVRYTHTGRAIQAVATDVKGAILCGIDPDHINGIAWGISGMLAAIAGVFFASYTQLSPTMWVIPLIVAVTVVIVGGVGSILGTLVTAHIIGFMETITTSLIAAELRGVFTMGLIILVLMIRPQGLFGRGE